MLLSYKDNKDKVVDLLSSLHNVLEADDEAQKKPRAIFRTTTLVRVVWIQVMKCSMHAPLRQHPEDGHLLYF